MRRQKSHSVGIFGDGTPKTSQNQGHPGFFVLFPNWGGCLVINGYLDVCLEVLKMSSIGAEANTKGALPSVELVWLFSFGSGTPLASSLTLVLTA